MTALLPTLLLCTALLVKGDISRWQSVELWNTKTITARLFYLSPSSLADDKIFRIEVDHPGGQAISLTQGSLKVETTTCSASTGEAISSGGCRATGPWHQPARLWKFRKRSRRFWSSPAERQSNQADRPMRCDLVGRRAGLHSKRRNKNPAPMEVSEPARNRRLEDRVTHPPAPPPTHFCPRCRTLPSPPYPRGCQLAFGG